MLRSLLLPVLGCMMCWSGAEAFSFGSALPLRGSVAQGPACHSAFRGHARASVAGLQMAADWYTVEKMEDLEGESAKYKFTVTVDGDLTKSSFGAIMRDFKKNAQFPGFRKGTIPPFMMPKVKSFVILDCLEQTLGEAVRDEGLELADDERKPTLDDDQTNTLTKEFKEGEPFQYIIEAELKPKAPAEAEAES
mmetsp:Transcript_47207/g.73817  ORF Transcript_47207/g.73817 Transcript_47207/m.73817 type:complete len:193 (-) Transcript_47207:28-606(-)